MGDHPAASTSALKALCKQKHTHSLLNLSHTHFSPDPDSLQDASFAATRVVFVEREHAGAGAQGEAGGSGSEREAGKLR